MKFNFIFSIDNTRWNRTCSLFTDYMHIPSASSNTLNVFDNRNCRIKKKISFLHPMDALKTDLPHGIFQFNSNA